MFPINTSSQSATQPNWGVLTLHRSVLISARFAGASLKKTQRGSDAKPMDTTIFFECVMSHSGCFEKIVLLMGSEKFLIRDPVSTMILGFSVLYPCFPPVSNLLPTCPPLVSHLSPFPSLVLSKKMILFHHDSPSLHCVSPTTLSRCR